MDANFAKTYVQVPHLKNNEVHVWKIDLESNMTSEEMTIISDEEKKKVGRLRTLKNKIGRASCRERGKIWVSDES